MKMSSRRIEGKSHKNILHTHTHKKKKLKKKATPIGNDSPPEDMPAKYMKIITCHFKTSKRTQNNNGRMKEQYNPKSGKLTKDVK